MLDDSITERKIKYPNVRTDNDPDEAEYDDDNIQLNIDQQSYRKPPLANDSEIVIKNYDQKIAWASDILD